MIDQQEIAGWFDRIYRHRGVSYLRPIRAYEVFHKLLGTRSEDKFLDVACGPGQLALATSEKISFHGIDISVEAISLAQERVPDGNFEVANAEKLPFQDCFFDKVTCLASLERMLDRDAVLKELLRVGKEDCRYCVMVRNSQSWRWLIKQSLWIVNKKGHQDARDLQFWMTLFQNAGFNVDQVICDQWPIHRFRSFVGIQRPRHYQQVYQSIFPLKYSNEFIFVLSKA